MKVLITAPMFCSTELIPIVDTARRRFDEVVLNPYGRKMTQAEVEALWGDVDAIIAGLEEYNLALLSRAPAQLKVIARNGVGYETVDVKAANAHGITVTVTRQANSEAVADCTFAMMLAVARRVPFYDQSVRTGKWGYYVAQDVSKKTLGILGFGAIGKEVAKRATGFDMEILAYDPYFDQSAADKYGVKKATIDEILEMSDFVTLHMPVLPETVNLIDEAALKKMKPSAYLINCARGPLVNEADLYQALKNGIIQGAALDAFCTEPLYESPLFELENTVFLPHLGGHSKGATHNMGMMCIDNIDKVLTNQPCSNIVTV